ncbi:MAG: DUF4391 domain-containing protein, partial [Chlamydiia bacterium]|nr:DUF4391 domain-containing protein [Chlamydiia bacterium]
YTHLLGPLIPYPLQKGENFREGVERIERICQKNKELQKYQSLLGKERQFNRKVSINTEIRKIRQEIDNLTRTPATC